MKLILKIYWPKRQNGTNFQSSVFNPVQIANLLVQNEPSGSL